jgi:hypothetical protein
VKLFECVITRSSTAQQSDKQLDSPGKRPITFVRRLTSPSDRSSRFVERLPVARPDLLLVLRWELGEQDAQALGGAALAV